MLVIPLLIKLYEEWIVQLGNHLLKNRQNILHSLASDILKPVVGKRLREILHIVRLDEECPNEAQHFVDVGLDEARLFTCAEAGKVQKFEGSFGQHKVVDTF